MGSIPAGSTIKDNAAFAVLSFILPFRNWTLLLATTYIFATAKSKRVRLAEQSKIANATSDSEYSPWVFIYTPQVETNAHGVGFAISEQKRALFLPRGLRLRSFGKFSLRNQIKFHFFSFILLKVLCASTFHEYNTQLYKILQ